MIIPPFADDESDTAFWLNGTKRAAILRSDWGDCTLDLVEHFAAHCTGREQAVYKIAGYVAYEGDRDVTPCWTFITGYFVAYFRKGAAWYEADDSAVTPTGTGGAPPTDFPYICIFERVDLEISMPWPSTSFVADETEEDEDEREGESEDEEIEEEEEEATRQTEDETDEEAETRRRRLRSEAGALLQQTLRNGRLAYESLCIEGTATLSPKEILAHGDLETVIKMTRAEVSEKYDPTTRIYPSSEVLLTTLPSFYHGRALPEAFFHDEHHDLTYLFGNMGDTVDAMRRIVRFLPHGEGLSRATRAYFGLQWKQLTPWRTLDTGSLCKAERFVVERRDTGLDAWKRDAFYCYE
jgi:hypothetical protein